MCKIVKDTLFSRPTHEPEASVLNDPGLRLHILHIALLNANRMNHVYNIGSKLYTYLYPQ